MVQKILIFKIFFLIFSINFQTLHAGTIVGKAKIIDGDTIHINKKKIRLEGIDAPERKQLCVYGGKKWKCGLKSTQELKKIINKKIVKCVTSNIDKYKRDAPWRVFTI